MPEGDYDFYKTCVKKLFFDTHAPDHVKIAHKFDGDEFASSIKAAGFELAVLHAKCHYGNSYYYTSIGHRHKNLEKDMIAEASRGCRKAGLHFMIYYSTGVDFHAGLEHDDWCTRDKEGNTPIYQYRNVCLNTPYTDELLVPQLEELCRGYEFEGIFLDMMTRFGACYCEHCKKIFAHDAGMDIPLDEDDENWPRYAQWRLDRAQIFFGKVGKAVHAIKPGLPILGNGLFTAGMPFTPHTDFGAVTIDFTTAGPQPLNGSFEARYAASLKRPTDLFICWTLEGWHDWSRRPAAMVKQDLGAIVANGSRFFLGGRIHPQGTIDPFALELGREVNAYLDPMINALKDAEPVRDIAILHSAASFYGPDNRFLGSGRLDNRFKPVRGAHRLLCENGRHCIIMNEQSLQAELDRFRAVILPSQRHLSPELLSKLKGFVENGGALVSSFFTACGEEKNPAPNQEFFDLLGIEYVGWDDLWYGYAEAPEGLEAFGEVLFHANSLAVEAKNADALSKWIYPYGMEHFRGPFGWGIAPPGETTKFPAVTLRRVGKGMAAFIAFEGFGSYERNQNPALRNLLLYVLDKALPRPAGKIAIGPSRVELSLLEKGEKLFAVLVSHQGERRVGDFCIADEVPPVENILIEVLFPRKPKAVKRIEDGAKLDFDYKDGVVSIKVPRLEITACIEIS